MPGSLTSGIASAMVAYNSSKYSCAICLDSETRRSLAPTIKRRSKGTGSADFTDFFNFSNRRGPKPKSLQKAPAQTDLPSTLCEYLFLVGELRMMSYTSRALKTIELTMIMTTNRIEAVSKKGCSQQSCFAVSV